MTGFEKVVLSFVQVCPSLLSHTLPLPETYRIPASPQVIFRWHDSGGEQACMSAEAQSNTKVDHKPWWLRTSSVALGYYWCVYSRCRAGRISRVTFFATVALLGEHYC